MRFLSWCRELASRALKEHSQSSLFFLQSNEVNQGDALEHNFSAMNSALLFPVTHLLHGTPLQQVSLPTGLSHCLRFVLFLKGPRGTDPEILFSLAVVFFVQAAQKPMLSSWSKLYKVFARCSALVVTAEENICCEELCAKMTAAIDRDALVVSGGEGENSKKTKLTIKNDGCT